VKQKLALKDNKNRIKIGGIFVDISSGDKNK
jgi:hypothetical protein